MRAFFGGGIVSFVSPCVLPLLPGYLAMMSGYSTADLAEMLRLPVIFVIDADRQSQSVAPLVAGFAQWRPGVPQQPQKQDGTGVAIE